VALKVDETITNMKYGLPCTSLHLFRMCYLHFEVCIFVHNIPIIPFLLPPSFRSLLMNELGPKGGIAIAEALKISKTITTIK